MTTFELLLLFGILFVTSIYQLKYHFQFTYRVLLLPVSLFQFLLNIFIFYVFKQQLSLFTFGLILFSLTLIFLLVTKKENIVLFLLSLKSYYLVFLLFLAIYSGLELVLQQNIYDWSSTSRWHFVSFFFALCLYPISEWYVGKCLSLKKLEYLLSSIHVLVPYSLVVLLLVKNFSFLYVLVLSRHSALISMLLFITSISELLIGFLLLHGISHFYDLSIYKHNERILQMQYDLQSNSIKQLEEHQEMVRRIGHDLHNHKIVMLNLLKNKEYDDISPYLDSYEQAFFTQIPQPITPHKVLNVMLLHKKELCLEKGIPFSLDIALPHELSITHFDLSILVGNLVDNAIEAASFAAQTIPPYIQINTKLVNSNFVFEIKNSFDGILLPHGSKFQTRKKEYLQHGLGLSNVEATIKKYNGTLHITAINTEFSCLVLLPLETK